MNHAHPDQPALDRIADQLDETLFVTAGAGSGKTRTLVTRIRRLVTEGGVRLRAIAAITFTDKAADELRERVRADLMDHAGDEPAARAALDDLDHAAIGTLHSFAQRILTEHPVEAGLPPRVEVLDEVTSAVAFEQRWTAFLDRLLEDDRLARPLLLLTAAGVRPGDLAEIARSFNQNWDLVETRAPVGPADVPDWQPRLKPILAGIDAACEQRAQCQEQEDDGLCQLLDAYAGWAERVRRAADESARFELLQPGEGRRPRDSVNGKGAKRRWSPGFDLPGLRARLDEVREACQELADDVAHAALTRVAVELRSFTLAAAEERRREGRLEFHDLLVMARQLLRHPDHGPGARRNLSRRYRRLLIDEFQDTDPIQIELAVLIASAGETLAGETEMGETHVGDRAWSDVATEPGRLFFVGDPQQSIYRFRRADIDLFLAAARRFGQDRPLTLTANHRSGAALVDWMNTTFGQLMTKPTYLPSVARRPDPPKGPPVAVLGRTAYDDQPRADDVRAREAQDIAAGVATILAEGWAVDRSADRSTPDWGPARAGDIAILLPTRLSLPFLEDALTDAGVPYRTESASLVYTSRLLRDLFLTLRAIDDPSDELSVVAALRSPLFGCGDDDLFTFRHEHHGRFDYSASRAQDTPPPADHPVQQGLAYMRSMHEARRWASPSALVDQVVRDRRGLELAAVETRGRARDLWHRVRFVTDQARAWADATGGTLRQYLDWVRRQASPGARVTEPLLPETDDDAVRIMTVHAAKGLQFPITLVAGLSSRPQNRRAGGQVAWPPDGGPCILSVGARVRSAAFDAWRPLDEQMAHDERIRLLYVACSRARDHLVLSLHRGQRAKPADDQARLSSAEVLAEVLADDLHQLPYIGPADGEGEGPGHGEVGPPTPSLHPTEPREPTPGRTFDQWDQERSQALAGSRRPRTVAATTLDQDGQPDVAADPGLQKRSRDLDLPPWRKGRYGSAIGRAVHGVLQVVDLATGEPLAAAVASQAMAEGISGRTVEARLRQLVEAALASPSVVEAAARPHWREVHVGIPLDEVGQVLEGYVDLLYRRAGGDLVVVDYKTGPDTLGQVDDQLDELVERYRMQGAAYAWAVGEATGEPVSDVIFSFLTPEGATEATLPDLPAAMAEAQRKIRSPERD